MPAIRTQDSDSAVAAKAVRPKPVPKTTEEKAAIELKKQQDIIRKRKLVDQALPILASKSSTKEQKLQAAEDFRLGVYGNGGMDDLTSEYGVVIRPLLKGCKLQAQKDYQSFLRYPRLVYEAVKIIGLAGKALVDLDQHGDGRRAFMLLKTFILIVLDAIILFREAGQEQWNHVYEFYPGRASAETLRRQSEREQAVEASYKPPAEETARIALERENLFHHVYLTYDEPLRAAIRKYKAELGPKASYAMCEQGSDWYDDLSHRCFRLSDDCKYQVKKVKDKYAKEDVVRAARAGSADSGRSADSGLYDSGYYGDDYVGEKIFWKSRDELRDWYYDYKEWMRRGTDMED